MLCTMQAIEDGRRVRCTRCGRVVRRLGAARPESYRLQCSGRRGAPRQPGPVSPPAMLPADWPCLHRAAEPSGQAACTLCGGGSRVVPLYACAAKGGLCTVSRVAQRTDGSRAAPWCCLACPQTERPPGLVEFLRAPGDVRGNGLHLAGWPWAFAALAELAAPPGGGELLFDDFCEHTFAYSQRPPHRRPWVGVFHHPPPPSPIAGCGVNAGELLDLPAVQASLPLLRGAIATSDHLASYLRTRLACPVAAVRYPGARRPPPGQLWQAQAWERQLWGLGWWLRNTRLLHQLPPLPGWSKHRTLPASGWPRNYDAKVARAHLRPEIDQQVATLPLLSPDDYRAVLGRGVLVSELLGTSANTVVCESIAHATPHAVNRHPAVVEYLGDDYPLYWRELRDLPGLLADGGRLLAAHEYLRELPAEWLDPGRFLAAVRDFLGEIDDGD